jgi:hypothetical protein
MKSGLSSAERFGDLYAPGRPTLAATLQSSSCAGLAATFTPATQAFRRSPTKASLWAASYGKDLCESSRVRARTALARPDFGAVMGGGSVIQTLTRASAAR